MSLASVRPSGVVAKPCWTLRLLRERRVPSMRWLPSLVRRMSGFRTVLPSAPRSSVPPDCRGTRRDGPRCAGAGEGRVGGGARYRRGSNGCRAHSVVIACRFYARNVVSGVVSPSRGASAARTRGPVRALLGCDAGRAWSLSPSRGELGCEGSGREFERVAVCRSRAVHEACRLVRAAWGASTAAG